MSKEIIEERFFELDTANLDDTFPAASTEAVKVRDAWRKGWNKSTPVVRSENGSLLGTPGIAMDPTSVNGIKGHSVRKEMVYVE